MNQGKIVEFIEKGKIISGFCIDQKDNRLRVLTSQGREMVLSANRILSYSEKRHIPIPGREEIFRRLNEREKLKEELKERVNVEELWELVRDDIEEYDNRYLAELVFGPSFKDEHVSALIVALFEERLHFKLKDGRFIPNTPEQIEKLREQRLKEKKRQEILEEGAIWLKGILSGEAVERDIRYREEIIRILQDVALFGENSKEIKTAKELLQRAGMADIRKVKDLLIKMGIWDEDENVELLRFEISRGFSEKVINEVSEFIKKVPIRDKRRDLTDLHVFTIDGVYTKDFDDALSLECMDGNYRLGIHIADVASVVRRGTETDNTAMRRGATLYLPRGAITMLPPELSEEALSLKRGRLRNALTLWVMIDGNGEILSYEFFPSLINIREQLIYEKVDESLIKQEPYKELYRLCLKLREKREKKGGINLSVPELSIVVNEGGRIEISLIDQNTPSRMMVAECMILYNYLFAKMMWQNSIPTLYRTQESPQEDIQIDPQNPIYSLFKARRRLNPLFINTEPGPHWALGLELYVNASSPLRRYMDLVIQRQMLSYLLDGKIIYNREELEDIRMNLGTVLKDLQMIKQRRLRYWLLKYLKQNMEGSYNAILLDEMKGKFRIILTDFMVTADMKRPIGVKLREGDKIIVEIEKVDPWNDILLFRFKDYSFS